MQAHLKTLQGTFRFECTERHEGWGLEKLYPGFVGSRYGLGFHENMLQTLQATCNCFFSPGKWFGRFHIVVLWKLLKILQIRSWSVHAKIELVMCIWMVLASWVVTCVPRDQRIGMSESECRNWLEFGEGAVKRNCKVWPKHAAVTESFQMYNLGTFKG